MHRVRVWERSPLQLLKRVTVGRACMALSQAWSCRASMPVATCVFMTAAVAAGAVQTAHGDAGLLGTKVLSHSCRWSAHHECQFGAQVRAGEVRKDVG